MLFVTTLLLIIAVPMEALAVTDIQCEINVFLLNDVSKIENCVLKTKSRNFEVRTFDKKTMHKIMSINGSNSDKCKAIFESIGIKYIENSYKQQEIIENLNDINYIISNTSYIKICEDGTQTVLSENQCLNEVAELSENSNNYNSRKTLSSTIYDYADPKTSNNGYMKTTVGYFYQGNGYFLIVSQWEWLKEPACRYKDAFSLYAIGMLWNNVGTKSYEKVIYYTRESSGMGKENIVESTIEDPTIDQSGVYYTWNLPNYAVSSDDTIRTYDLMCQMWATARVTDYDDFTQELAVYTAYVHKKVAISGSYSISAASKGVKLGLSSSLGISSQTYDHYFKWDYIVPARQAGEA